MNMYDIPKYVNHLTLVLEIILHNWLKNLYLYFDRTVITIVKLFIYINTNNCWFSGRTIYTWFSCCRESSGLDTIVNITNRIIISIPSILFNLNIIACEFALLKHLWYIFKSKVPEGQK